MGDENWASKSSSDDIPTASQVYSLVSEKVRAVSADAVAFDYKNDQDNPTNITSSATTAYEAIVALDDEIGSIETTLNGALTSLTDADSGSSALVQAGAIVGFVTDKLEDAKWSSTSTFTSVITVTVGVDETRTGSEVSVTLAGVGAAASMAVTTSIGPSVSVSG